MDHTKTTSESLREKIMQFIYLYVSIGFAQTAWDVGPESEWRILAGVGTNHTAHQEARARGYLHASQALYPNCSGSSPMEERCRMIDVCTIANPAPTELALCLMNWGCVTDDIARETRCMARPTLPPPSPPPS